MNILQLTAHFRPNIGGVETHLNDLCKALIKKGFNILVLTYRPLQTSAKWKMFEKEDSLEIIRIPWIPNLFYKFVKMPFLEFIYLLPGLFVFIPYILLTKRIDVIHAHGLVSGFVGVFWGKLFNKKVIISTHSIYHFPKKGLYKEFVKWIFNNATFCLGLSQQAKAEIKVLGIADNKVNNFTYWIDLEKFKKVANAKNILGWEKKFVVLFVGRLVKEKGIKQLVEASHTWDANINLVIIGSGPEEEYVRRQSNKARNIKFLGQIDQDELPLYYNAADLLVIPSTHEEGFGRVILESLACSTPVVAAKRGAIPEAMDNSVGRLISITPQNITNTIEYFYTHPKELIKFSVACRPFAERRFSEKNVETIIRAYKI